ncbi:MAG: cytochrome c3 family protein [Fidelibacterota bacterium]
MRTLFTSLLLLFLFTGTGYSDLDLEKDACISCHSEIDEDLDVPVLPNYSADIHVEKGLGCSDCHGGNPNAWDDEDSAMWDNESFLQDMSKADEIAMCGKCHSDPAFMRQYTMNLKTDQEAQYWTSHHGESLKDGNENVATCTSCHSVHGILPVDDPRSTVYDLNIPETCGTCHSDETIMAGSGFPTDQLDEYKKSVHGNALLENQDIGAPACNDCHGNHGAQPPDVEHISDVCGSCHYNNMDLFQQSHLMEAFKKRNLGQCESCHGNHAVLKPTDEFLNWDSDQIVCVTCHKNGENDVDAKALAKEFYTIITDIKHGIDEADSLLKNVEEIGMEVSEYYYNLEEANRALIQTRTGIHSFNSDYVKKTAEPGMKEVEAAILGAKKAMSDWMFRRKGLFAFSLIISFLTVVLYLKIKEMENK